MLSKWDKAQITEVAPALRRLPQPVNELYSRGPLQRLLSRPLVAIVGSRKVSAYGKAVTERFAHELAQAGVVIVSGLALGVDSIAHQACLDTGGQTIAVLPAALDRMYPAQHYNLAQAIIRQGGALVSEYAPGSGSPQKYQFIARNRIIAGLSRAVIITEAAINSGSLHTAHFALEQGIDVWAVPGNITSVTSAGTNKLIQMGAQPLLNTADVLETLHITPQSKVSYYPASSTESAILEALRSSHGTITELLSATNITLPVLQQTLTMLEINGAIFQATPGSWATNH